MAMVDVVSYSCLQAGLRLKSIGGLVQKSAAIWRCSAFIAWTVWTRAITPSHDVSTINIVLVYIINWMRRQKQSCKLIYYIIIINLLSWRWLRVRQPCLWTWCDPRRGDSAHHRPHQVEWWVFYVYVCCIVMRNKVYI